MGTGGEGHAEVQENTRTGADGGGRGAPGGISVYRLYASAPFGPRDYSVLTAFIAPLPADSTAEHKRGDRWTGSYRPDTWVGHTMEKFGQQQSSSKRNITIARRMCDISFGKQGRPFTHRCTCLLITALTDQ